MKKLVCLVLVLVSVFGLAAGASAATDAEKAEWTAAKTAAVQAMLDENEYKYDYSSGKNRFKVEFSIENSFESCTLWALLDYDMVEFDADYPLNAPEEYRDALAIFITRINEQHPIVKFYMDYDSGLVGSRVIVYTEDGTPTAECLDYACWASVYYAEAFGDTIYKLITGEATVDEAVSEIEELMQ